MKWHLNQAILVIMVALLICTTLGSYADNATWDCPECGRTGNTGNFCGSCAHPAPWLEDEATSEPIQESNTASELVSISEVHYLGRGMVEVICSCESDETLDVVAFHYFNEAKNADVERCYQISYCEADHLNNSYVLYGFTPGRRYWIKASTSTSAAWYDFSIPTEEQNDVKVKINKIELIKLVNWGEKKTRLKQFSAKDIETTCTDSPTYDNSTSIYYVFNEQFSIGKYKGDKEFVLYHALKMPNGDIIAEENMTVYQWPSGTHDGLTGWLWDRVYSAYGCIPTGEYSYISGFENYAEKEVSFTVTE